MTLFPSIDALTHALQVAGYYADRRLATSVFLALKLQRPLLLEGEPGVGKTAIAEALAQRIYDGNVPYKLKGKEVYLLDLTALVAGIQLGLTAFMSSMINIPLLEHRVVEEDGQWAGVVSSISPPRRCHRPSARRGAAEARRTPSHRAL